MGVLDVYIYNENGSQWLSGMTCGVLTIGGTPVGYGISDSVGHVQWNGLSVGESLSLPDATYEVRVYGGANYFDQSKTLNIVGITQTDFYMQLATVLPGGPTHIEYELYPPSGTENPGGIIQLTGHLYNEDNQPVYYLTGSPTVILWINGSLYGTSVVQGDGSFGWNNIPVLHDTTYTFTIVYDGSPNSESDWDGSMAEFQGIWSTATKFATAITIKAEPDSGPTPLTTVISGILTDANTGAGLAVPIKLYRDGVLMSTRSSDPGGNYSFNQTLISTKVYKFKTSFDGNEWYLPKTSAEISVSVGTAQTQVNITWKTTPDEGGAISVNGNIVAPPDDTLVYPVNTALNPTAVLNAVDGWSFDGWYNEAGDKIGSDTGLLLNATRNMTIEAVFYQKQSPDDIYIHTYRGVDVYQSVANGKYYFFYKGQLYGYYDTVPAADAAIDKVIDEGGDNTLLYGAVILGGAYILGQALGSRSREKK